jgi:hypothetical protein
MYLPMLATDQPTPISLERLKQILAHLSATEQQRKLATDICFFKQQAELINSAAGHLKQACSDQESGRQLLAQAPQMLRQLVVITTAVLQQLAAQRGSELEVSRAAGVLADVLGKLLDLARNRPADIYAPTPPADTATLRMMHHTGGRRGLYASSLELYTLCSYVGSPAGSQHARPGQCLGVFSS